MVSEKKDLRFEKSRRAILEAGIAELLINPNAGMSDIAQRAGIGRATLYRHFDSRDALIKELTLVCYEEVEAACAPYEHLQGKAAIEKLIEVLMPLANRFRFLIGLWSFVEEDEDIRRIEAWVDQELTVLFDQAKAIGEINRELPTAWLVAFFDSTLMAGWMLIEEGDATAEQAAAYMTQSFLNGCGHER